MDSCFPIPLINYFQVSFAPFAPLAANHISGLSKNPFAAAGVSGISDEQFADVTDSDIKHYFG